MMTRALRVLFFVLASTIFGLSQPARTAEVDIYCVTNPSSPPYIWSPCSSSNPLPVTAGSGGLASTVYGPTAVGSAAANPPVQIGGTATGTSNSNVENATVKAANTTAVATDTSLVTQLNPNSPGIIALGQVAKASSVPVTFATDQYGDPCSNPLIAKSSVPINITSGTTTELVPISGSTAIYVCHFSFTISEVVTTANTLQFEHGTSNNCAGTNKLTGLYGAGGVTAGDPIVITAGFGGTIFATAAAHDLCALTAIGASGSFQGVLTYVQQ